MIAPGNGNNAKALKHILSSEQPRDQCVLEVMGSLQVLGTKHLDFIGKLNFEQENGMVSFKISQRKKKKKHKKDTTCLVGQENRIGSK